MLRADVATFTIYHIHFCLIKIMFINFSRSFVDFVSIATSHERGDRMNYPIGWWKFLFFIIIERKTLSRHCEGNEILIVQLTLYFPFFCWSIEFFVTVIAFFLWWVIFHKFSHWAGKRGWMLRGFEDECGGVMPLKEINFHAMGGNKINF